VPRKLLVSLEEVRSEGSGSLQPAGERHGWGKVSDHMVMGARPPVSMGYTPSFGGRQFHRRKSTIADLDQPVGGRYQYEHLLGLGQHLEPRLEAGQTMPPRRSTARFAHHFAYHGGSPRGLPAKDDPYAGRRTADGYLTEIDLRDTRGERPPVPKPQFPFSEYRDLHVTSPSPATDAHGRSGRGRREGSDSARSARSSTPRSHSSATLGHYSYDRDSPRTFSHGGMHGGSRRGAHGEWLSRGHVERHGCGSSGRDRALDFALMA
jgi:hypothetical protein